MLLVTRTHLNKYLIIVLLLFTLFFNVGVANACFCCHHNTYDEDLIVCPEEPEEVDYYLEGTVEYYNQPGKYLDKPLRLISNDGTHYI